MRQCTLGDLIADDAAGFACGKSNLVEQGVVHLRPFNIGVRGEIDLATTYQIPADAVPKGRGELRAGDILFNNTNSAELVGKAAIIESDFRAGFSNHLTRIRVNKQVALSKYLLYVLLDLREKGTFTAAATQWVSQAAYRVSDLKQLPITLPPLTEQQRIVDILDRAAAIQRLRRAAEEKAREIIPALFVDMFGDPATNPKGWPMGSIGEVLTACDYGSSTKATDDAEGLPMLRMGNVNTDGSLDLAKLKFVDLPEAEQQKYLLRRGDVLFNRTNSKELVGKTGVWLTDHEAVFASYFIRLRTDARRVLPEYLWAFLNSRASKARLFAMARGAIGQANINSKELKAIPLPLPPLQLQQRFVSRLDALHAMQSLHARAQEASAFTAQSLSFQILGDGA
jgi:type I restriction enzyme S subunit